jgi:broad specificity phosphatase PhoE
VVTADGAVADLRIHLVRHLPTEGTPAGWLDRDGLRAWFATEGARGIVAGAQPRPELVALVAASDRVVVSPLARARATADAVLARMAPAARPPVTVDPDLVEIPLPVLPVPRVRLPLDAWDAAARIAWLAGWAGGVEARPAARARGRRVARRLDRLAADGATTLTVVAHGFTNILLAHELRRLGWAGPRLPAHGNGAATTYRRGFG